MRALFLLLLTSLTLALGGCGGGDYLAQNDLPVKCLDKPEPGPCKKRVIRYFYDYRYDRCRTFHYGGCQGRVPFETQDECEKTCLGGGG